MVTMILIIVITISIIKIALASDFPYSIPPITHESSQVIPGKIANRPPKMVAPLVIIANICSICYDSYFALSF